MRAAPRWPHDPAKNFPEPFSETDDRPRGLRARFAPVSISVVRSVSWPHDPAKGWPHYPANWHCELLRAADVRSLVFIDESFAKTGMRRESARSLRGQRVTGTRPFRSWNLSRRRDPARREAEAHDEPLSSRRPHVPSVREAAPRPAAHLPTYSPELNPIERLWADMNRQLRTLAINVESELLRAVRRFRASTPILEYRSLVPPLARGGQFK